MPRKLNKEKLFRLRFNNEWSQQKAADECGIYNVRQYVRLEDGETIMPRKKTLESLGKGFNIDINDLILNKNDKPNGNDTKLYYFYKNSEKIIRYKLYENITSDKLIVFGLDNTIIKGYNFSWKCIWDYLGLDDNLRKEGKRRFQQGDFSYMEWCNWKCNLFIEKKLHKNDIKLLSDNLYITDGFDEIISHCKQDNYVIAIISGGIDTFMEFLIPDYKSIFNYATINKFIYDHDGYLEDIIPTPYDFKEKETAIQDICRSSKINTNNTYFIACGYNSISAINVAKTCISINTPSIGLIERFHYNIEKADLSQVIDLLP